jgi:hypothetical protein
MFGDTPLSKDMREKVNIEYKQRLNNVKNVLIDRSEVVVEGGSEGFFYTGNFNGTGKKHIYANDYAAIHEISHAVDYQSLKEDGFREVFEESRPDPLKRIADFEASDSMVVHFEEQTLLLQILKDYIIQNKDNLKLRFSLDLSKPDDYKFIMQELSPYSNPHSAINANQGPIYFINTYLSKGDKEQFKLKNSQLIQDVSLYSNEYLILKQNLKGGYYDLNTELKARLNHLRIKATQEYGYDLNKKFNINDYPELKNDRQYQELNKDVGLSDEGINKLMQVTADNNKLNMGKPLQQLNGNLNRSNIMSPWSAMGSPLAAANNNYNQSYVNRIISGQDRT